MMRYSNIRNVLSVVISLFLYSCHTSFLNVAVADVIKSPPIVFVYNLVPRVCMHGIPGYIKYTLEQAILTQPNSDIIMASNFGECLTYNVTFSMPSKVIMIDTSTLTSDRTLQFVNLSSLIFQTDGNGELWVTSAMRFFYMEDIMSHYKYSEIVHVEADNMLYGDVTDILPTLRNSYAGLAATPLTAGEHAITASVLWISSLDELKLFNNHLLMIGDQNNKTSWDGYINYLRTAPQCCKIGGINPNEAGWGVKPFAVNEMTMLGYYHHLQPTRFKIFPVTPVHKYHTSKFVPYDLLQYSPQGKSIGGPTGVGIWDSNSIGQYLGGTSSKRGHNKGFTDPTHLAGLGMRMSTCKPIFVCSNRTLTTTFLGNNSAINNDNSGYHNKLCVTMPFMKCEDGNQDWSESTAVFTLTPVFNLHVHGKHTHDYSSQVCECQ